MSFINIEKDGKIKNVTKAAFLNFFKDNGWVESDGSTPTVIKKEVKKEEKVEETFDQNENDNQQDEWAEVMEEDEDIEKPISEMTKDELIQYANDNDIDINGLTKVGQIREAIRKAIM